MKFSKSFPFLSRSPKTVPEPEHNPLPGFNSNTTERGSRPTPENSLKYQYNAMWVDPDLRQAIIDVREMDNEDGRVKKIHKRMANTAVKGGLKLTMTVNNKRVVKIWSHFEKRLQLNKHEKLFSDARGLAMEGNLPLQVVIEKNVRISDVVRMPSETIVPVVGTNGRFKDPAHAYDQYDLATGQPMTSFALWQLQLARIDPQNYDDKGSMGRPYLDANRDVWQKLRMTEEDLVIRRRQRAPLKLAHVLEGASQDDLDEYRQKAEASQGEVTTDHYLNKKGSVTAIQGDANLDQIADVSYLLDTFFAGSPAPKGLFGYTGELARDILEDLKRDYFDEIDAMQDVQSALYDQVFRFELLLHGINPDQYEFKVEFKERKTSTPNQDADLALKQKALGADNKTVWETANLDHDKIIAQKKVEANSHDPYPDSADESGGDVSITPSNAPKGESATSISNK